MSANQDLSVDSYRGSRALVLGATGFVGQWVVRALEARGAHTVAAVRDRGGGGPSHAALGRRVQLEQIDLQRLDELPRLLERIRPAIVFNLVGYGIDPSERDEELAYLINAELVAALGESLARVRTEEWTGPALVHVGSAAEYGAIEGNLAEESRCRPLGLYGASKLAGTRQLKERAANSGLRALTARLFTLYGFGEHPKRLLPSLLQTSRKGKPLDLTTGRQMRDFTYVEDVAEGLLRLGLSEAKQGEVVNLATGRLTSVRRFSETAASLLGIPKSHLRFGTLPTRPDEMQHDPVTVERLRELISWTPPTTVEEGIRRTIQLTAELQARSDG
jgi:dTDP-6-deoxy-L-talose 4-dehydrogenase (NAD+)